MRVKRNRWEKAGFSLNMLIAGILFLISLAGIAGYATVSMRQNITETGQNIRALESRLVFLDRSINRIDAEVAEGLTPNRLHQRMEEMGLDLERPPEDRIIRLDQRRQEALARGEDLFELVRRGDRDVVWVNQEGSMP